MSYMVGSLIIVENINMLTASVHLEC